MAIDPIDFLSIATYGDVKTGKSSVALTAPKPMVNFDFDQSFDRAAARLFEKEPGLKVQRVWPGETITARHLEEADLIVRQYDMPLKIPGQPNEGFLAIWEGQFLPEILTAIAHPRIKSIVVDTGTIMWLMDHQAHLERVQRSNDPNVKARQNLIQIEYARPNTEARAIYTGARNRRKNIISVHHLGAKYGTGQVEVQKGNRTETVIKHDMVIGQQPAGFSQTSSVVDVVLRNRIEVKCRRPECAILGGGYFEDNPGTRMQHGSHGIDEKLTPTATFELCGYTLEAQNQKLINPDFLSVITMVNALRQPVVPIGVAANG